MPSKKKAQPRNSGTDAQPLPLEFNRAWLTPGGKRVALSEAWGRHSRQDDEGTSGGQRLICSSEFLGRLLAKRQAELLLLIKLQRYEKGLGNESSRFSHTTAVLRIKSTLSYRFYGALSTSFTQIDSDRVLDFP